MKNLQFKIHLIAIITTIWFLLPGLAAAQAPSWAPSEGYSYVTKNSSQQWMIWSSVASFANTTDTAYEHETVIENKGFANRDGTWSDSDSEEPQYWWSNLPTPYRDTTALDSTPIAGCQTCDNFAIGSADAENIQANTWYRTIDWLIPDTSNINLATSRVLMNGQLVKNPGPNLQNLWCPVGGNGRWCFNEQIDTYGLTLWRAPVKITNANGDFATHYTTATGNQNDKQARKDIICAAERDARFKGSMLELSLLPSWQPPWEFRRMGFEFAGQPLGTALYVYQATHPSLNLRYTQYYDPAIQAWTPWYQQFDLPPLITSCESWSP